MQSYVNGICQATYHDPCTFLYVQTEVISSGDTCITTRSFFTLARVKVSHLLVQISCLCLSNPLISSYLFLEQVVQFYCWKHSEFQLSEVEVKTNNIASLLQSQLERIKSLKLLYVKDYQRAERIFNYGGNGRSLEQSFDWGSFSAAVAAWEAYTSKLRRELLISLPHWQTHQFIFYNPLKES